VMNSYHRFPMILYVYVYLSLLITMGASKKGACGESARRSRQPCCTPPQFH
jgi:hypothetical protein